MLSHSSASLRLREPAPHWAAPLAAGAGPLQLEGSVRPSLAGYRLLRRAGQGRRTTLWLADDLQRGGQVALKLMDRTAPGRDASFAREFALAATLRHAHVLRLIEQGAAGPVAYLAMEFVAGGDLRQRIAGGVNPAEALALLRGAATGLAQLHRRGLVHRDVKPANFLLRADGAVVLADFGLVAATGSSDPLARAGAIVGTPRYVAPEQSQGSPAAPAADVYSLGVLFHEMLCGKPPFGGETLMEVLSQHLVAVAPPLPPALAGLQGLADALLHKDPARRPQDADAVLQAVEILERGAFPRQTPAGPTGTRWNP
jgi:serine/threonine protein kinase